MPPGVSGLSRLQKRRFRVRLELVLLAMVFAAPIIGALVWRPAGSVNHGELVEPARPISDVLLQTLDGNAFRFAELQPRWALLYFSGRQCENPCHSVLSKIRQIRLAQGRHIRRIVNVLILDDGATENIAPLIKHRYPGLVALTGPPESIELLMSQFSLHPEYSMEPSGRIYLVDPLGNLVMSYAVDADPTGMKRDLMRLLRVSQVG